LHQLSLMYCPIASTVVLVSAVDALPPPVLGLLAEPRRWQLLSELSRSDRRVGELTDLLGAPQNLVSYHLGELRKAGVVAARRSSADGRDVYYRADLARCRELLVAAGFGLHPALRLGHVVAARAQVRGRPLRVLFLCTGNSSRSQMAEALLVARSGGAIEARSAGSHPRPVDERAVAVMAARGIDISSARSKHLRRFARTRFDRVVTLCDRVREICPEFPGPAPRVHWSVPDPAAAGEGVAAFEAVADELDERIDVLLAELTGSLTGGTHP
jgi:protein-tyrosine-phosphatase/DNA-binding transcriptional ArsR family regulator